jgi:hypothetical protein
MTGTDRIFPFRVHDGPFNAGIDARDYAAILFVQGMISRSKPPSPEAAADLAYLYADALVRRSALPPGKADEPTQAGDDEESGDLEQFGGSSGDRPMRSCRKQEPHPRH